MISTKITNFREKLQKLFYKIKMMKKQAKFALLKLHH